MAEGLKTEAEALIMDTQRQCLFPNNYQIVIIKANTDPMCRLIEEHLETTDLILSSCTILIPKEYKD